MIGERYASWVVGISLGIGFLVVLDRLQIPYFLFYPRTTQTIIISSFYDYYFFLVSTICVPWTLVFCGIRPSIVICSGALSVWAVSFVLAVINESFVVPILYATVIFAAVLRVFRSDSRSRTLAEILPSAIGIFALVEWSSICYWISAAVNPHAVVGAASQELDANLTFFLYPAAIPLMLLLLFSWIWAPLIPRLSRPKARIVVRYRPSPPKPDSRMIIASLDLILITAIIVFFYPYLAGQSWIVGQDAYWRYIDPVNSLVSLSASQALNTSASHGVYVLFLYLIQSLTGIGASSIVKYAPLALAFATAAAVLFSTLRGRWSFQLATLSSISTLLWFPTTLGIYVDIQANWLALFFWLVFLGIYFANVEGKFLRYIIMAVLSFVILLVHPWTWGVFVTTLLFTAVISRHSTWSKHCVRAVVASLVLALPMGIAAYSLSRSLRSDLTNTIQLYVSGPANPVALLRFGDALTSLSYNLGPILSPILLLLCLVGAYVLARRRDFTANYLIAWTIAWCIGSILIAPTGLNPTNAGLNETGLWRMLYISPLPFFLALGMEKCVSICRQPVSDVSLAGLVSRVVPVLSILSFAIVGMGLFAISDANLRLLLVGLALLVALMFVLRFPNSRCLEALVMSVLVLVLLNAAFRTLFPLLLDPHNIFSSAVQGPSVPVPGR